MGTIKLILRIFLFTAVSLIILPYILIVGIGKWKGIKRISYVSKFWCCCVAKILGLKVSVHGDAKSIKSLIVSNHLSYIDIFILGAIFPLRFAAMSEITKWPFLGYILGRSKPIWVDRSSKKGAVKIMNEFIQTVKNDIYIISFPEGAISDGKSDLLPFKSTTFEAAIRGKFYITPVLIKYKDNDKICWCKDETLVKHANIVLRMKNIYADLYILPSIMSDEGEDRKSFSKKVYDIMNSKYMELTN